MNFSIESNGVLIVRYVLTTAMLAATFLFVGCSKEEPATDAADAAAVGE